MDADRADAPPAGTRLTVAFDWNGTLVDDIDRAHSATAEVLRRRDLVPPDIAAFRARFKLPIHDFLGSWGLSGPDLRSAVAEWNQVLFDAAPQETHGASNLLRRLHARGVHLGVISAAESIRVENDADRLSWRPLFDFVRGSAESKRHALGEVIARYGRPVVYVGDTEYDIVEAKAAGAVAVGFSGGYRSRALLSVAEPDHLVDALGDVGLIVGLT